MLERLNQVEIVIQTRLQQTIDILKRIDIVHHGNSFIEFFYLGQTLQPKKQFVSLLSEVKDYRNTEYIEERLKMIETLFQGKTTDKYSENRDVNLRKAIFYLQLILRQQASFQFENNIICQNQKEVLIQLDFINQAYKHAHQALFDPCQAPETKIPLVKAH